MNKNLLSLYRLERCRTRPLVDSLYILISLFNAGFTFWEWLLCTCLFKTWKGLWQGMYVSSEEKSCHQGPRLVPDSLLSLFLTIKPFTRVIARWCYLMCSQGFMEIFQWRYQVFSPLLYTCVLGVFCCCWAPKVNHIFLFWCCCCCCWCWCFGFGFLFFKQGLIKHVW